MRLETLSSCQKRRLRYVPLNRDDVTTLLTKLGSNLTVKTLLDSLAITTEFEQSMGKKWATPVRSYIQITYLVPDINSPPIVQGYLKSYRPPTFGTRKTYFCRI